jgi:DNA repair exonuclease SbcCD ATPase subunit
LPRIEELEELVNKFEDKIKLGGLINEKRFADLELKIGELNEKLKEVTTDFPKLKEKAEELGDLLNIVNLGLVEYKDNFEKIDSSFSEFKKIPETLESVRANLENKMRELNESVSNLTANVDMLKNLKEDIVKSTEETISSKVKTLEEGIEQNKVEMEHVKRDLDGFSVALRSFERTIELTNLDDIIRRFDSLDRKINNTETELEKLRSIAPNVSITTVDVEILKKKLREMGSSIMDVLNRMNEFEININKKTYLIEDLTKMIGSEDFKTQISKLEDTKTSMEKIYNDVNERVSRLTNFDEEIIKLKASIEELKGIKSNSDEMIIQIKDKINSLEDKRTSSQTEMNEEIGKLKTDIEELKTMKSSLNEMFTNIKNEMITEIIGQLRLDYEMRISNLEQQIKNFSSLNFDKILTDIRERKIGMDKQSFGGVDDSRYEILRKKVEDIEKSIMNINKSLSSYPKTGLEPRPLTVGGATKEIQKNITDEIFSLKDIISRLSLENNDMKKVIRDVRMHQMESITSDIFVGVTSRISTIEKKLCEIEEEISKMRAS